MPRLSLLNLFIGFFTLFFAASAGAFLATTTTRSMMQDPSYLTGWAYTLQRSAHGHTNLFGLLHIALGLTLPYSRVGRIWQAYQTLGLLLGTLGMSVLMLVRSQVPPSEEFDFLGLVTGVFLTAALLSLGTHTLALGYRLAKP